MTARLGQMRTLAGDSNLPVEASYAIAVMSELTSQWKATGTAGR
jgi:hypothetical protein